ncbi:MAG: hypothetical protein KGJ55_00320 [Gammaproteobacteria bacterium]|nr:hypothetical protein [Gammaproteobacteria bacterium]
MDVLADGSAGGASRVGAKPLPPTKVLLAVSSAGLVLALVAVVLASAQPQLGVGLVAGPVADAPPRVETSPRGPPPSLRAGTAVVWLQAPGLLRVTLRSDDLTPEPDAVFTRYADFRAFLARQQRIWQVLRAGGVFAGLGDGRRLLLPVAQGRPPDSLGWLFWMQIFSALGALLVGCGIWAFRPAEPAARYSAIAGASALLMELPAAVYSTRMLALPGTLFAALSAANHLGSLLCAASAFAVLWHYPRRFAAWDVGPPALLTAVSWWMLEQLGVSPLGMASANCVVVVGYVLSLALAATQWWRVRGDPLARAAFEWFVLSGLFGASVLVLVVIVPGLVGYDTGWLQAYAFGFFLVVQGGVALGIARYRLYDLERWWLRALGLVIGALAVVVLDTVLVSVLPLDAAGALLLSLAVSGWLYFPLRQWLVERLPPWRPRTGADSMSQLLPDLLGSERPIEQLLPDALAGLFAPLDLQPLQAPLKAPELRESGAVLAVPGLCGGNGYALRWADRGARLFRRQDVLLAASVQAILQRCANYEIAVRAGVESERLRLAQDLHDDIGARLLTLIHRSEGPAAQMARDALENLRLVVHGLAAGALQIEEALSRCREEIADRCDAVGVRMVWSCVPEPLPQRLLPPLFLIHLSRVLREAVTNALRHSRLTRLSVGVELTDGRLTLRVANDGSPTPPARWSAGLGLRGMRARAAVLGGRIDLRGDGDRVEVICQVPLAGTPVWGVTAATDSAETEFQHQL